MFGYTLYILLFIVAALCLIPGSILVIVGGVLFGPVTGTLISLVAATTASALSFMLARWLGRELLLKYVGHTATFQAIEKGIAHSGVDFLIIFIYTLMSHELASEGISWAFIGKLSVAGLALFVLVQAAKAWARHKHVDPAPGHEYAGK